MTFLADRAFPYCKGCGHTNVARRLDEALSRLGLSADQIVLTSDIGCVGLVDRMFPDIHTVHTLHGRSTAVATGAVLADALLGEGRMKNVVAIGDGGATIGLLHLSQAALLNVDLTVLLHNNMLYGMTGGQHSGLSPEGFVTSTTPGGNWVPAVDMEQLMRACHGAYFARKVATDADLADVIAEAIAFPGFAMVEILELCTGFAVPFNHLKGTDLRKIVEEQGQRLGVLINDRERSPYHDAYRARFPKRAGSIATAPLTTATYEPRLERTFSLIIAGSAGEHVQSAAATLCRAAILSGLHCVQKNDYPPTVSTGFSVSEVRLSPEPIRYTGVDEPDAVLIVSLEGLREVASRGDLARVSPTATVVIDDSLPGGQLPSGTLALPLRASVGGDLAALASVAVLVERSGIVASEALRAALDAGRPREAAAVSTALTLSASRERSTVPSP